MKYIVFISFFISQVFLGTLYANDSSLKLNKLDELRILKSLDINPSFVNDKEYIQMKKEIDKTKIKYFLKTLKKGAIFIPDLQELLADAEIPDTFLYMAMVESKFLADVKSHKNAAGLWQLMPKTAKKFDLEINSKIDERLDPIKSTKVAVMYLNKLHDRFGKWYLAAIAYNCGQTRLARVIKEVGSDDISVLLDSEKKYLPTETRNYMRRIIVSALLAYDDEIITKNNANHLYGKSANSKLVEVFFNGGVTLKDISKKVNIPIQMIKTCNPHLLNSKLPSNRKRYHIYLPLKLVKDLKALSVKIARYKTIIIKKNKDEIFIYKVKKGDTPYKISMKFNNRLQTLKELNLNFPQNLKVGMSLKIKR